MNDGLTRCACECYNVHAGNKTRQKSDVYLLSTYYTASYTITLGRHFVPRDSKCPAPPQISQFGGDSKEISTLTTPFPKACSKSSPHLDVVSAAINFCAWDRPIECFPVILLSKSLRRFSAQQIPALHTRRNSNGRDVT